MGPAKTKTMGLNKIEINLVVAVLAMHTSSLTGLLRTLQPFKYNVVDKHFWLKFAASQTFSLVHCADQSPSKLILRYTNDKINHVHLCPGKQNAQVQQLPSTQIPG